MAEAIKTSESEAHRCLGAAAGFGVAIAAYNSKAKTPQQFLAELEAAGTLIKRQRPTAVNLFWGVDRVLNKAKATKAPLNNSKP
jgi:methylthioribose-1-phosphate isomerase